MRQRVLMKFFTESQFSYCSLVWMCCDKISDNLHKLANNNNNSTTTTNNNSNNSNNNTNTNNKNNNNNNSNNNNNHYHYYYYYYYYYYYKVLTCFSSNVIPLIDFSIKAIGQQF